MSVLTDLKKMLPATETAAPAKKTSVKKPVAKSIPSSKGTSKVSKSIIDDNTKNIRDANKMKKSVKTVLYGAYKEFLNVCKDRSETSRIVWMVQSLVPSVNGKVQGKISLKNSYSSSFDDGTVSYSYELLYKPVSKASVHTKTVFDIISKNLQGDGTYISVNQNKIIVEILCEDR